MRTTKTAAYARAATILLRSKQTYKAAVAGTRIPWEFVACAHWRESSGNFRGVLHNGEHIIGTGRRTRLIPRGRGPFSTWQEAAKDALVTLKALHKVQDWSDERFCYESERYNGFGYVGRHPSPYLWAGTTVYAGGKYTSDGNYDPSHVDTQLGVVPLMQRVRELDAERQIVQRSSKLSLLARARSALKALGASIAGLFSLDTLTNVREYLNMAEGVLRPETVVVALVAVGGFWLLINWITRLDVEAAKEGRYTPSGQVDDADVQTTWDGPAQENADADDTNVA